LAFSSGNARAQTLSRSGATIGYQTALPADNGHYFFTAGGWGWGVYLSHSDMQGLSSWSSTRLLITVTVAGRVSSWLLLRASMALWAYLGTLESRFDTGNGVCVAWPYYLPSTIPFAWSR